MSSRTEKILELALASNLNQYGSNNGNSELSKPQHEFEMSTSTHFSIGFDEKIYNNTVQALSTNLEYLDEDFNNENNTESSARLVPGPSNSANLDTVLIHSEPKTKEYFILKPVAQPTAQSSNDTRGSTILTLRKIPRLTYNDPDDLSEHDDFSSGSSDNFYPGSEHSSSDLSEPSIQNTPSNRETIEEEDTSPIPKKGKKRMRNPDIWIKVKAKRLRNSG